MGYYTYHKLEVYDLDGNKVSAKDFHEISKALEEQSGYESCFDESIKWYECEADCLEVSKKFPHLVIKISGEGEVFDDIWDYYFSNGKKAFYKAEIVRGIFKEEDLQ